MEKPTPRERIQHMLDAAHQVERYVQGLSLARFEADARTCDAVCFQFSVIGEAVRSVDPAILQRHPYAWNIVRAFRNFIVHEYHAIRLERIYYAANDLGPLKAVLQRILDSEFQ